MNSGPLGHWVGIQCILSLIQNILDFVSFFIKPKLINNWPQLVYQYYCHNLTQEWHLVTGYPGLITCSVPLSCLLLYGFFLPISDETVCLKMLYACPRSNIEDFLFYLPSSKTSTSECRDCCIMTTKFQCPPDKTAIINLFFAVLFGFMVLRKWLCIFLNAILVIY